MYIPDCVRTPNRVALSDASFPETSLKLFYETPVCGFFVGAGGEVRGIVAQSVELVSLNAGLP